MTDNCSTRPTDLRRFLGDRRGSIMAMLAISLAVIFGVAGLAVDASYLYSLRTKAQGAADAAALAAVSQLPDTAAALTEAQSYAAKNMPVADHGTVLASSDVVAGQWDAGTRTFTPGGGSPNAVQVTVRRAQANGNPAPLFFANVIGQVETDVAVVAVASKGSDPVCLLALDPSSGDAFTLDSNAAIDLNGCSVHVNSTHSSALSTDSNATVSTDSTCVVGDYSGSGGSYTPTPDIGCDPMPDPLAGLAEPPSTPCNFNNFSESNHTDPLDPGVYCGGLELDSNSNAIFNPGTYVIKGGDFHLDSNTIVQGTGVFFFLTDGALIEFDSSTSVDFTAPTTGTYAGILFFQDPDDGGTHLLDSDTSSTFEGVIYLPNGDLFADSNSNIAGSSSCTMIVARRFFFDSNAGIDLDLDLSTCGVPLPAALSGGNNKLVM